MKKKALGIRHRMAKVLDAVWRANMALNEAGLAPLTWGNVSQFDRQTGLVAIKPSGVEYRKMTVDDIVLTDIKGQNIASSLRPSSDLQSHLELYRAFPSLRAVAHTHSTYATAFAQACLEVPCLGTTHADYCHGKIPLTDPMPPQAIKSNYERNTGKMIVRKLRQLKLSPQQCPFILVVHHGPFAWGSDAGDAVENAIVLESICKMAFLTFGLTHRLKAMPQALIDKHFFRKHGKHAYYGQICKQ